MRNDTDQISWQRVDQDSEKTSARFHYRMDLAETWLPVRRLLL